MWSMAVSVSGPEGRAAMPHEWNERLTGRMHEGLDLEKRRCACFANMVCSVIESRSVLLDDLAAFWPDAIEFASRTRRMQYFFRDAELNDRRVAQFLVKLLTPLLDETWVLALDRTEWRRRGEETNLLILAVCVGDVAIPLFWTDLGTAGNSSTAQRIELLERFIETFGVERIRALLGDREFIGEDWFGWLQDRQIPFVMRIRKNFRVQAASGRETDVRNCFRNLRVGEDRHLGTKRVCGVDLQVSGLRRPRNDYVILVQAGVETDTALPLYARRWEIETLFEKFKTHGFNLEDSRLRGPGKAAKLLAVLAVALAWCYAIGHWHVAELRPLRLKSHGRREKSVFRRGLDLMRQIFHHNASQLARCSRQAAIILKRVARPPDLALG